MEINERQVYQNEGGGWIMKGLDWNDIKNQLQKMGNVLK